MAASTTTLAATHTPWPGSTTTRADPGTGAAAHPTSAGDSTCTRTPVSTRSRAPCLHKRTTTGPKYIRGRLREQNPVRQPEPLARARARLHFVRAFRPYLEGTQFTLLTDNSARSRGFKNMQARGGRLGRWMLARSSCSPGTSHHGTPPPAVTTSTRRTPCPVSTGARCHPARHAIPAQGGGNGRGPAPPDREGTAAGRSVAWAARVGAGTARADAGHASAGARAGGPSRSRRGTSRHGPSRRRNPQKEPRTPPIAATAKAASVITGYNCCLWNR